MYNRTFGIADAVSALSQAELCDEKPLITKHSSAVQGVTPIACSYAHPHDALSKGSAPVTLGCMRVLPEDPLLLAINASNAV
jgi:hypothetical protein